MLLGLILLGAFSWGQSLELEPYDLLELRCDQVTALNASVEIDGLGVAALPMGRRIVLAGMTVEVARQTVQRHYEGLLGISGLKVRLDYAKSDRAPVRIFGSVAKSFSTFPVQGLRLMDLLTIAKVADQADLESVEVRRAGKREIISVEMSQPDQPWNIELQGGDKVFVPALTGPAHVFVLGAVIRPGSIEFRRGLTIRQALEAAGGTRAAADLSRIEILRQGNRLGSVDVELNDLPLRPGDTVRVLEQDNSARILVLGGVVRPGRLDFREGLTLYAAIQEAGGLAPGVPLGKVTLIRRVNGNPSRETHDLAAIVAGRAANPTLRPDDRIEVPERPA
ncbi:MAG TPA: SLBB domain-containing protein [Fimbriimonadaceae bacterium]|nr:SLBB domain-containing protein [Fimbriimonadaceae bacterium]